MRVHVRLHSHVYLHTVNTHVQEEKGKRGGNFGKLGDFFFFFWKGVVLIFFPPFFFEVRLIALASTLLTM